MERGQFDQFITPLSSMRLQAQLGKEVVRRNKEGRNIVKLSMARVIKVNYKYNTVDVVTTLYKNSTAKDPASNGKFSARLPVSFGGTTPEGKPYGTNTLVTVGSLVLIGFLEGNKEHPIVLNIYGEADNQSKLTRTTFSSADESDEELQRELWQLFTLYPSMTFKNIDGNGNQEVTFSGKSFMFITDTDPDNDYVNDSEFDYDLLPSARYADGTLIEPKSPDSPTVLYVHQGIYSKHRVTFFIKSDGTVRLGSRHTNGEGITFMEMGTDGSFNVFRKEGTTNPEAESEKFSKFGIESDGTVALESPNNRLEVNQEGIYVNGKSLASFVIGGSGDGDGDGDGGTISFEELIENLEVVKEIKTELSVVSGQVKSKVESATYSKDFADVNQKVAQVEQGVANTNDRIDGIATKVTYSAKIVSTNGTTFKNGEIDTTLFCRVSEGSNDITDQVDVAAFKWTRVSDDAAADAAWNAAHATPAKSIHITSADFVGRASFDCDVVYDTVDVTGQVSLVDLSDNTDLDDPTKLTRYERSLVRADIAEIVGRFLDNTESMPTITDIDASGIGQVYAIRKSARDVGMATTGAIYTNFENSYNSLKTYLSAMNPKAWDIVSTAVNTIDPVVWGNNWNEYKLRYTLMNAEIQKRQVEYADAVGEGSVTKAIQAVSNSDQYEKEPITNPMEVVSPIASVGLPEFQGRHTTFPMWSPAPESAFLGNRIRPVTSPSFSSGGVLTLYTSFYGDGTSNDEFKWDTLGRAIKTKRWEDDLLDGSLSWTFDSDKTGFKIVKVPAYVTSVVDYAVQAAGMTGTDLSTIGAISATNQIRLQSDDRTLYISVSDSETGWGETYTPSDDEIKAFFNGWKMCNGTFGTPYNGTGNKVWHPIGDTNLNRSTIASDGTFNPVPTTVSAAYAEQTINYYQVVYRLADAVQEIVTFDGILPLIAGSNTITLTYPVNTPEILVGDVRYAINLATVTDTLKYIIPVLQTRLSKAEEVITEDSIVNTVMNSVSYQYAMKDKADASALGQYATGSDVDEKIKNGLDSIDFSPYVTQSQLSQTATDITAKFSATGGMNIINNSIGYAGLDFWESYSPTGTVETLSNNELDTLGFGSGFQFNPDGNDKGVMQLVNVIPNQPYTLSWYLNKRTGGATADYRFYIQIRDKDRAIIQQIADNSADITVGYLANHFTFTPTDDAVYVYFVAYGAVDATLTGTMLTIGDVPLQWSLATGELYNTNIRMDIRGIRVSQLDANRKEVGYTQISPDEFAGYHADSNGVFRKVFYLNGDETVSTKIRAEEEITMGSIKIVNVDSDSWEGWAFIANQE